MEQAFRKRKQQLSFFQGLRRKKEHKKVEPTVELYQACPNCKSQLLKETLIEKDYVCEHCGYHFPLSVDQRINMLCDSFKEFDAHLKTKNRLGFPGYDEKICDLMKKTDLNEAVVTGVATIKSTKYIMAVMDQRFMMGSMGSVVGEKITKAIEHATKLRLPLVIISTSGGARMQEGMFSLWQMAKTSAALRSHDAAGLLYVSVLTHPTMGGVSASFGLTGDVIIAEPKALIGFAGPRVIEQTIKETLPEGFQTSEYLLEHGLIDDIVSRHAMKEYLATLPRYFGGVKS